VTSRKGTWNRLAEPAAVIVRWVVGALFIYMGLRKALAPVDFLKLVREYDLVQTPLLLNSVAAILPWFEVFCGVLLVAGVAVRGTAAVLIAMLIPFTVLVVQRALELHSGGTPFCAIRFDCGCGAGEVYICNKIAENVALVLLSAWLLAGRGRALALRFSLGRTPPRPRPDRATFCCICNKRLHTGRV